MKSHLEAAIDLLLEHNIVTIVAEGEALGRIVKAYMTSEFRSDPLPDESRTGFGSSIHEAVTQLLEKISVTHHDWTWALEQLVHGTFVRSMSLGVTLGATINNGVYIVRNGSMSTRVADSGPMRNVSDWDLVPGVAR